MADVRELAKLFQSLEDEDSHSVSVQLLFSIPSMILLHHVTFPSSLSWSPSLYYILSPCRKFRCPTYLQEDEMDRRPKRLDDKGGEGKLDI